MEILQVLKEIDINEFGIITIVMFILLGLVVELVRELIIDKKK